MKKLFFITLILALLSHSCLAQLKKFGIGGDFGANYLIGDTPLIDSKISPNAGLHCIYRYSPRLSLKFQLGYGKFRVNWANTVLWTSFIPGEVILMYSLLQNSSFIPFLHAGMGAISFTINGSPRYYDGMIIGGGGFIIPISSNLSFLFTADMRYTSGDDFDGINRGLKDGYACLQSGLTVHLGQPVGEIKPEEELLEEKTLAQLLETGFSDSMQQTIEDTLHNNLEQLRSKIEKLKNEIAQKDIEIEELKTQLETKNERIELLETQGAGLEQTTQSNQFMPEYNEEFENKRQSQVAGFQSETASTFVEDDYQNALDNFYARNYQDAIMELTELSNNYPDHPLASNFIYWIGECYFSLGNYSAAIEAFEEVQKFDKSYKLDDALIMLGLSYLKLGDQVRANQNFQELLQRYPDSEYADKASRYLK